MIEGKTIDLKLIDESDIEDLRVWRNSRDVSDFMLSRSIITKDQQIIWYNKIKDDPSCVYWIILSKEGLKLGLASLTQIDKSANSAEPGLYIGMKKYRNSFFGIEANYHLLDYAFGKLGLEKIYGTVLSANKVAYKMNTSFGFVLDTVQKGGITIDGVKQDLCKIVLAKNDFYASKMTRFFKRK